VSTSRGKKAVSKKAAIVQAPLAQSSRAPAKRVSAASNVAPPKNTGGGGMVFEDDVCAWLLAAMLVGEPVFGVENGSPIRLDFQTRPDGWFLDDVLVTTAAGATHHRFAVSVKSNEQFTATSAPSDFVAVAWEQWFHIGSKVFDVALDYMGLVTAPLSGAAASSVSGLTEKARAHDPELFGSRIMTPKWASADERALFQSFSCPASLGRSTTNVDTARILQRLRFVQHDFGAVISESQNRALELCRRAVRSQIAADAQALWSILREIAAELRPHAGSLTLFGLVDRLRTRIALAEYPDHARDWVTLDARSAREAGLVRDKIADRIRLPRAERVAEIIQAISEHPQVTLLGSSGVGKSALARAVFEQRVSHRERTLWVDAPSLDRVADFGAFESSLQVRHPLAELLGGETSQAPVVILDGLDRLYADHLFRTVATLLRMAGGSAQTTKWRVVAVCQSQEWQRVLEGLQRNGAPVIHWSRHETSAMRIEDLEPARQAVPALARLFLQPHVGPLLTNLKLLDLVVRRLDGGASIDASGWVGESSVAEWFWSAEIDRGDDRLARGHFARSLAQAQADQLVVTVSVDSLDAGSLPAAASLTADQLLVQVPDDRVAFAHDLYGDWARLRVLLNHRDDLAAFLQTRHESPLWHRAIRLLGIHLLERANGITEWRRLMASFGDGNLAIVRDLLLEAPAFAMNAGQLLESVFPDLIARNGELLRRLLTRFLAFATVPDERIQEIARANGMDLNAVRAAYRRPHWPYWLDVLAVLHTHRDEALRVAPSEIAKIVEMWLEFVPTGSIRRREAAELAVMLGQRAVDSRDDYGERGERQRFYKCALMAAPERPDDVARIARTAAERIARPVEPKKPDESPLSKQIPSMFSTGVMRGPWPDGPLARVDEAFQDVVLDTPAILELYRVRPALAREVVLATLIEPPREEYWGSGGLYEQELDVVSRHEWHPALYTHGPFLACLRSNFAEGLELIMRLVDFTDARAGERKRRKRRARAIADGHTEAEVDQEAAAAPVQRLLLYDGGSTILTFQGDATVYGWSSGFGNLPYAVEASLMALEQYFYMRLDAGEDIAQEVSAVLARSKSVAPLGVLCDLGKRQMSLFEGPLRALLSAPELYSWEINKLVHDRNLLMIGAFMRGHEFIKLAQQFHGLEHRKRDLRYVATERLFRSGEMQTFFSSIREWWKKREAEGDQLVDMATQLHLLLDPANYEVREDPTHGLVIVNVALERVQAERTTEVQEFNDRMLVTIFPTRCRTILDERRVLTDAELQELWQTWTRIRELAQNGPALPGGEERLGDEYVNAITGGTAVFLWHDPWLSQDETRRTAIEVAIESLLASDLPEREGFHSEHDVSTWTWDCFIAESAAMLWVRAPQDLRWRQLVAEMVFTEKYAAVRLLFSRCAERRSSLGEDFERLRRLVIGWAHATVRIDALHRLQHAVPPFDEATREGLITAIGAWREQSISSFVDGSLEILAEDWCWFDDASRFAELDAIRRKWNGFNLLDFHLVRCSHEWIPLPDEAQDSAERERVVQFWRVALEIVTERPRADLRRRDHLYPQQDEVWVLERVAAVVLQLRPAENPEHFWAAVIELHSEAHDWPEKFLTALHRRALASEQPPASYAPLVRAMTQRAFVAIEGKVRWAWHEEVWDALIGIDYRVNDVWAERHANHVRSTWDVISGWMENVPLEGRRLGKFARWLATPPAVDIRLRTLAWFLKKLQSNEKERTYGKKDVDDDLAKLLNVVWDQDQQQLRASSESLAAFRGLLVGLVERQNSLGLELQGRIGGLA
jgi:hypothetical protein